MVRPTTVSKVAKVTPHIDYPGRAALDAATRPLIEPLATRWAANTVQRLLGFWVLWHTYGSRQALVDAGYMTRQSVYRLRADFVQVFGVEVEAFQPAAAAAVAAALRSPAARQPDGGEPEEARAGDAGRAHRGVSRGSTDGDPAQPRRASASA